MSEAIRALQGALGLTADGRRGPVTTAAILQAADEGRLRVVAPGPVFLPRPEPEEGDAIPGDGDARLAGVHPDLVRVVRRASLAWDRPRFTVIEGLRTRARQAELVARGASKTQNSRHLTGHAVDLWPLDPETGRRLPAGTPAREEALWAALREINAAVQKASAELRVRVEWGGDWGWDAPHFQLPRKTYPA